MDHASLAGIAFETERLRIRRLREEDATGLFAMMSDPETCADDGGYAPTAAMDQEFMKTVAKMAQDPDRFSILLKETGEMVGTLHLMDPIPERAVPALEIGYCMAPAHRMQGYGSEAVLGMVAHLHGEMKIPLVTAGAFDFNIRSQRMLEKMGFVREGVTKCAFAHPQRGIVDMVNYVHMAP